MQLVPEPTTELAAVPARVQRGEVARGRADTHIAGSGVLVAEVDREKFWSTPADDQMCDEIEFSDLLQLTPRARDWRISIAS